MTDRRALAHHRRRSRPGAMFLHEIAADQIEDRLSMVNRSFKDLAIVTGHPDVWRRRFPAATLVEDAETLDLTPGGHDLVIHAMALHWANDPVGQIIQCRRALRPDGLFLSVGFGGRTLTELRRVLAQAETQVTGGLSPRVAPMAEVRDMGGLLQRAGLALPVADIEPLGVTYADLTALMHELRHMGETNALALRDRSVPRRRLFQAAAEIYAQAFPSEGDPSRILATFELIYLLGWSPAETQPQAMRPGTARHRLADALGTSETRMTDDDGAPSD